MGLIRDFLNRWRGSLTLDDEEDESGEVEFECVFFNRENETVQFKTTIKAKVEPKAGSDGSRTHFTKIDVLTWVGSQLQPG